MSENHKSMFLKCKYFTILLSVLFVGLYSCNSSQSDENKDETTTSKLDFDAENAELTLPKGFKTVVVAEELGPVRHIAVRDNGDIYGALYSPHDGHTIVALRDTDGDGVADEVKYFGDLMKGTGMRIHGGYLYYGSDTAIVRYRLKEGELLPEGEPETIVKLFEQNQHEARSLAFDDKGNMYVNIGVPSNACQVEDRTKGSPGQKPCPLLEQYAAIWKFDANKLNQTQQNGGQRYVSGIRNCVALDWNTHSNHLYAVMHGRDQLSQFYPDLYSQEEGAELPGEEFLMFKEGANYGWPYTYWDGQANEFKVAPEYGGDGKKVPSEKYEAPMMAFDAHMAPNGLHFYAGSQFPDKYKNGAFVAFHGSWNRSPEPQKGYKVMFVPFGGDQPSGDGEVFANGFSGADGDLFNPSDAKHRPCGLAEGPDGSLYVSDDAGGTIFRIVYVGEKG